MVVPVTHAFRCGPTKKNKTCDERIKTDGVDCMIPYTRQSDYNCLFCCRAIRDVVGTSLIALFFINMDSVRIIGENRGCLYRGIYLNLNRYS